MTRGRHDAPPCMHERLVATRGLLDVVSGASRCDRIELFHRVTRSVRVSTSLVGSRSVVEGFEEGVAVRLWIDRDAPRFAAVSGFDELAVRQAVALARRSSPCGPGTAPSAVPASKDRPDLDEDPHYGAPRVEPLEAWLDGAGAAAAWIEAASTVECLSSSAGVAAARSRSRVWSWREPLSFQAARGLRLPPPVAPEPSPEVLRDGVAPADRRLPWVVRPEPAAALVQALVRVLHAPGSTSVAVGEGWRVADDPGDPSALFGGRFDDAGFPAARTVLADGRGWRSALEARGCLRRASFRDPPTIATRHLVVEGGDAPEPADALVVTSLRIHPVDARWFLQLGGRIRRAGVAGEGFRDLFVAARPAALVRRCAASVGKPRTSYRGVATPSLVFEGSEDAAAG